jgi:hypothetical protein
MMCSQLAYQCYLDAGKDYTIKIKGGILQGEKPDGTIRLIDLIGEIDGTENRQIFQTDMDDINEEALIQEIYESLVEAEDAKSEEILKVEDLSDTVLGAANFMDNLKKIMEAISSDMPLDALFVTPADICYKSENLKIVK